jgi:hypothetical protein
VRRQRLEVLRSWFRRRITRSLRSRVILRRRTHEYCILGDGCSIGVLDRFYAELQRLREGE